MPIPEPREKEKESDYIIRAVRFLIDEGTPRDQAVAIAYGKWRSK